MIPVALYGNTEKAAAIDSKGWIIYISKPDDSSPNDFIEILKLPNNEKAVNVVCGENFIVALSMSNRIYISKDIKSKLFTPAEELRDIKIRQISGSIHHCFALSQDGRVFAFGENFGGCIGSSREFEYYSIFKEMLLLKQYNIVDVYAEFSHSIFRTLEGQIIACGDNSYGELPINSQPYSRPNLLMETVISNGVTFCVAGSCISLFFFGYDILRNPNRRVIDFSINTSLLINNYNSNLKTDIFLHIEKPKLERVDTHTELKIYSVKNIMKLTVHEILGYDLNSKIAKVSYHNKMYTQIILDSFHSHPISDINPEYINCVMMQFQNMCNTLNSSNNPSIIKVHGICFGDSTQPPCALLDYCPHDINYLFRRFNGFQKVSCLYHLSLAMKDFHEHGIIHRNLKPECIFFDNNFNVKITGFGISCFESVSYQTSLKSSANSVIFMAPELLKNKTYDEKVDVYSFGYITYYVLSDKMLPNISDAIKGKIKISYKINKIAGQLIKSCLSQNPKKRPSFSEIVDYFIKHEFKLDDTVGTCPIRTE